MLKSGVYERVINRALKEKLSEIEAERKSLVPIDGAEASQLSAHQLPDKWFLSLWQRLFYLHIFIRNILQCISYLVDNTSLIFCGRILSVTSEIKPSDLSKPQISSMVSEICPVIIPSAYMEMIF